MIPSRMIAPVFAIVAICMVPSSVHAEWMADLYAGAAVGIDANLTLKVDDPKAGHVDTSDRIRVATSLALGGRVGYWLVDPKFLGFDVDVEHFWPEVPAQGTPTIGKTGIFKSIHKLNVEVTSVAIDALFRVPGLMPTQDIPAGRLQPYASVGPAVFITELRDTYNLQPPKQTASAPFLGFKIGVGANWMLTKTLGLFTEYRYTRFTISHDKTDFAPGSFTPLTPTRADLRVTVQTQHILAGVSFRF